MTNGFAIIHKINMSIIVGSLFNFIFIMLRIFLMKPNIIYIGDSHAPFLFGNKKMKRFSVKDGSKLIIWSGPMLLYAVSRIVAY